MSEAINYNLGFSSSFWTAKCVNVRAGDYVNVAAAAENAVPIEGSDKFVQSNEIVIVTKGSFQVQSPDLSEPVVLRAGDMAPSYRYRSAHQIVSAEDGSAYTCLSPKDGQFWQRQAGFVADGEQIVLDAVEGVTDERIYVAVGGLTADGEDYLVGALKPVTGRTLTGVGDTYFIHIWKQNA